MFEPVEHHPVVDLIAHNDRIVAHAQLGDLLEFLPRKNLAGRVLGGVQEDKLGPFCKGRFHLCGIEYPPASLVRPERDMHTLRPAQRDVRRVGIVEGLDQQGLVAGLQKGLDGNKQTLRGPRRHGDLGKGIQLPPERAGEFARQDRDQVWGPSASGVLIPVLVERSGGRFFQEIRA